MEVVEDYAQTHSPECYALTATTPQMPSAARIAEFLRPKAKVILGGPHATLINAAARKENPKGRGHAALMDLLARFDAVVAGDGEVAIFRALRERGLIDADDPGSALWQKSSDFEASPWPARHLVDVGSYHYSVDDRSALSLICQLGCPFESLTEDAFVFSNRGFETIAEFRNRLKTPAMAVNGDMVTAISEPVSAMYGRKTATHFIEESIRDVYEVRHRYGIPIRCTPEHLIMAVDGENLVWRKTSDLRIGDWIACRYPEAVTTEIQPLTVKAKLRAVPPGGFHSHEVQIPTFMDVELAWLTGFMLGDGCFPMDGRPSVHVCIADDVRERVISAFYTLFGADVRIYATDRTKHMQHGWVHSRAVYEFFVQTVGINPANKLHVPSIIKTSSVPVIQAFLDGLWEADGYTTPQNTYLTTANYEFAREVSMLLLMARQIPTIQKVANGRFECWRVGIVQGERFPVDRSLYKSEKSGKWHWRTKKSANRFGIRRRTLKESGLSHPLDLDGIFYSQVKEVAPAGTEMVYDLTVPDGENFVANGIIVHNCGFCGGRLSPMLRRIRTRSAESVIDEMMHLHKTYGVTGLMFYDDELNVNRGIVELMRKIGLTGVDWRLRGFVKSELFTEEQAEAMYEAGFRWLLCGFESAHPRILKNINKKATVADNTKMLRVAHRAGLKVKALMSCGHPGESEETIQTTKEWLLSEKPDDFDCTIITTYPGCPYYDSAKHLGDNIYCYEFNGDRLYSKDVNFATDAMYYKGKPGDYKSYVWTDYLKPEELVKLRDDLEVEVRTKLGIPFNQSHAALRYEHSMGQSIPANILRTA